MSTPGALPTTAIVVAYDGGALLEDCIDALLGSDLPALQVVVADNASIDGAPERLVRRHGDAIRLLSCGRNLGFAGAVNAAIEWGGGDADDDACDRVHVLINQDCVVRPDALAAMVAVLARDPDVGVVGGRLLEPDGATLQHAGGGVRDNGLTFHLGRGQTDPRAYCRAADVEYVTGALFAFRASTWRVAGPFDEAYFPAYFEEVDFCMGLRARGLRVAYEPAAVAVHHEAGSSGRGSRRYLEIYHRNRVRFVARHLLRRGRIARTLGAEGRWLLGQRELGQVRAALRAYLALPRDLLDRRAAPRARRALPARGRGPARQHR